MPEASVSYIGEISLFGYTFAPVHWTYCNGATIAISQNPAMYSLLGTAFGGNGRTDFALPRLASRTPVGASVNMTMPPPGLTSYAMGENSGAQTRTLVEANLPSHNHTATFVATPGTASATLTVKSGGANTSTPTTSTFISGGGGQHIFGTGSGFGITDVDVAGLTVTGGGIDGTVTVNTAGSGTSFGIQSPVTALGFGILQTGLFPPRN